MGRRVKPTAKLDEGDGVEHEPKSAGPLSSSDDDEEANEDLSLKIVEKALSVRATKLASTPPSVVVSEDDDKAGGSVVVLQKNNVIKEEKVRKKERKKKKSKGRENQEATVSPVFFRFSNYSIDFLFAY